MADTTPIGFTTADLERAEIVGREWVRLTATQKSDLMLAAPGLYYALAYFVEHPRARADVARTLSGRTGTGIPLDHNGNPPHPFMRPAVNTTRLRICGQTTLFGRLCDKLAGHRGAHRPARRRG